MEILRFRCFMVGVGMVVFSSPLTAQHEYSNWYFGYNAAVTFTTGVPSEVLGSQMGTSEGSASVSDANGNLLFYSNGKRVWDAVHTVMPNGTGLNSGITCTQAALAVPDPGNPSRYYLFTPPTWGDTTDLFCYSIVDMTLNGGLGDVIEKNTPLFSPSAEKVTATRHANGVDYWVIAHSFGNADFYVYRITPAGIDTVPAISTVGTPHNGADGEMKASPCGDKLALVVYPQFSELFDFDNATGVVSHAVHLEDYDPYNEWGAYGVGFSHRGTKLYVTQEHPAVIVQYNMLAGSDADIVASADTVYFNMNIIGSLQNGPKGKTYVTHPGGYFSMHYLGCINYSDSLGDACHYVDTAFVLDSGTVVHCLPNFILSGCDGTPTQLNDVNDNSEVSVYPNPTDGEFTVTVDVNPECSVLIRVVNLLGQVVLEENRTSSSAAREVHLDLSNVVDGIHFVYVMEDERMFVRKVVKQR